MKQLVTLRSAEEIKLLQEYLSDKDIISFDTETTGLTEEAIVIGYSFCAEEDLAYYVITAYWDVENKTMVELPNRAETVDLFESLRGKALVAHNGVFDCAMIHRNYGVSLIESLYCDTMIMSHLLDENRRCGLKELGANFYGEEAKAEQAAMKESVERNGGSLTKVNYELYKADADLIAKYGAQDTILTFLLFWEFSDELKKEKLEDFFYDESMPLLRGPTYQLNTTGLKVDTKKLAELKKKLEVEILELQALIAHEVAPLVKDAYPGDKKTNHFNINSGAQLAWLLFKRLDNMFPKLGDSGREIAKALEIKVPYTDADRRRFIRQMSTYVGHEWSPKKKVRDWWTYCSVDSAVLKGFSTKYRWVHALLQLKKTQKILSTYVEGILEGTRYGIIRPSFLQHGTTSGRYSSRNPNFQNLPKKDTRIKECIVSRPGKVFVGADYSQLEPRVFASRSQDPTLMACFESGQDFYALIGCPIFGITDCSLVKGAPDSFEMLYPALRDKAKVVALATPYGRTARQQASVMGISEEESQDLIDSYFNTYPLVLASMEQAYDTVKKHGVIYNSYGRPRRIPEAKKIRAKYGNLSHGNLPYEARTLLNLAYNAGIQGDAGCIMNRSSIALYEALKIEGIDAPIVIQVHDFLAVECEEALAGRVAEILKDCLENTVVLKGVKLEAKPKIGVNLAKV